MDLTYLLNDFFIFEIANNHQGCLNHAEKIIHSIAKISCEYKIKAAVKFQLRNLDTFIHPDYQNQFTFKHIERFKETKLSEKDFKHLMNLAKENNLLTMATVFDEDSIETFLNLKPDILKIASCSAKDYPLLNKLKEINSPTIISTGSLLIDEIQKTVRLLGKDETRLAIMHCVAIYPTLNNQLSLDRIDLLKRRFPCYKIGFSTHEDPEQIIPIQLAAAKGATFFEKHVDIKSNNNQINKYSATPGQIRRWLDAYFSIKEVCSTKVWPEVRKEELLNLFSLKRGVFARKLIFSRTAINKEQIFLAIPAVENQILAEDFFDKENFVKKSVEQNAPLMQNNINKQDKEEAMIESIIERALNILKESRVTLPRNFGMVISNHYGLEKFTDAGVVFINLINKDYVKKYLIFFKGQIHPEHFHPRREEDLQLLYGDVDLYRDEIKSEMIKGEYYEVSKNVWHKFIANEDSVVEEITTRYQRNGSHYKDETINSKKYNERKIEYSFNGNEFCRIFN